MRRKFKEPLLQQAYDALRDHPPADVDAVRGSGGIGNAYAVGFTQPDKPNHIFPRGSRSYAGWAAGVDNARAAARKTS